MVNSKTSRERSEPHSLSTNHHPLPTQPDLFADFNGIPDEAGKTLPGKPGLRFYPRICITRTMRFVAQLILRRAT